MPQLLEGQAAVGPLLDFRDDAVAEETLAALGSLGFAEPARIVDAVRRWQAGHVRAFRSQRARELMDQMLPALLTALGRQPHPDATFTRFDAFIAHQPAGVQLLSLFQRNPSLLDRVAAVLGAAPWLADYLAQHASALEGLLSPQEDEQPARLLRSRLRDARLLEDVIGIIRRSVKEADFSLSVATMEGRLDADAAGERRSALADAALAALLPPVLADFSARFGSVRGGAMAVVLLGKAGGREMMAGSDLDLMLIYTHPEEVTESRGARSLPASQWFIRAAHSFVAAVTAPGADGQLYAVDMRLRPSGNKGPVAVSLASFRRYHAEDAWTWERMALTRARVVAGPPRAACAGGGGDRRGDCRGWRSGADPGRRGSDAGTDGARAAARWDVGRQAAAGRAGGHRVHRADAATGVGPGVPVGVQPEHLRGAGVAGESGQAGCGRCGVAGARRPGMADRAGHAAHHRRPRDAGRTARGVGATLVAGGGGVGSGGGRCARPCVQRWTPWPRRSARYSNGSWERPPVRRGMSSVRVFQGRCATVQPQRGRDHAGA